MNFSDKITDFILYAIIGVIIYLAGNIFLNPPNVSANLHGMKSSIPNNYQSFNDPEQTAYNGEEFFPLEKGNYKLKIYPKANYKIYAAIMSKSRYIWGWDGDVAPYDLALAWSDLMLAEYQKGISYSQANRWYFYRYESGYPLPQSYINTHSANVHIIPANSRVLDAVEKAKNKQEIYMEGYLVYIKGTVNGREVWWNSSLSRNDTGDGACEVFYVTKAVLSGLIYQ